MRLGIVVVVACLGCGAVPAPTLQAPPPTAAAIVARMADTYRHAKTYVDHGRLIDKLSDAHGTAEEELDFATAYEREHRLRFEFHDPGRPSDAHAIYSDGTHTYERWGLADHIVDHGTNLPQALAGVRGVSHALSTDAVWMLNIEPLFPEHFDLLPSDDKTWHLRGKERNGQTLDLWIDRHTYLLTATRRSGHIEVGPGAPFDVEQVASYTSAIDQPVPPEAIAMIPLDKPIVADEPDAWIGIMTASSPPRVSQVIAGAPADKSGMHVGDEVVSIDGHPVADPKEVVVRARQLHAKKPAPIVVRRDGAELALTVVPEPRPDASAVQSTMVDKPAPAISVSPLAGGANLELATGRVTVLDFWATWCGPCAILSPHLDDLARAHPTLRVIGISDEEPADVAAYVAKHKSGYAIGVDAGNRATSAYLVQGLPSVFVIDKAGVVRYAAVGVPDFKELDAAIARALQ